MRGVKLTAHLTEVKEWVKLNLHSPKTPPWRGTQYNRDNFTLI